jgi:hypothetical protein
MFPKRFFKGGKRYENLAVPLGLHISPVTISKDVTGGRTASNYVQEGGTISDELFDELLEKAK